MDEFDKSLPSKTVFVPSSPDSPQKRTFLKKGSRKEPSAVHRINSPAKPTIQSQLPSRIQTFDDSDWYQQASKQEEEELDEFELLEKEADHLEISDKFSSSVRIPSNLSNSISPKISISSSNDETLRFLSNQKPYFQSQKLSQELKPDHQQKHDPEPPPSSITVTSPDILSKVKALEEEMKTFQSENMKLRTLQKQVEEKLSDVNRQKMAIEQWAAEERERVGKECEERRSLVEKELRIAEKAAREAKRTLSATPSKEVGGSVRKEKAEIEALLATIEKVKVDADVALRKKTTNELRLKNLCRNLQEASDKLETKVKHLEEGGERVLAWAESSGLQVPSSLLRYFPSYSPLPPTKTSSQPSKYMSTLKSAHSSSPSRNPEIRSLFPPTRPFPEVSETESEPEHPNVRGIVEEEVEIIDVEAEDGASLSSDPESTLSHFPQQSSTHSLPSDKGRFEIILPDGRKLIRYRNGTEREVWLDGSIRDLIRFPNGDTKFTDPTAEGGIGQVVYFHSQAGTTHTQWNDGREQFEFSNGQVEFLFPDGSKEVLFPDGTRQRISGDGTQESFFPDGVVVREGRRGREILQPTTADQTTRLKR